LKETNKQKFQRHEKDIRVHETPRGWAIVILPDKIIIDTYNKPAHIHTKNRGVHIPVKYKDYDEIGLIIELHIERNKGLNLKELMEELS